MHTVRSSRLRGYNVVSGHVVEQMVVPKSNKRGCLLQSAIRSASVVDQTLGIGSPYLKRSDDTYYL